MAAEMVGTLKALLGTDNASRTAAEKAFSDARQQHPGTTVASLFQALAEHSVEEPVREQAAVLLRQCLGKLREEGSTWSKLGEQAQGECRGKLLELFEAEPSDKVRRKVADIIQSVGNQIIDIDDDARPNNAEAWPTVMPKLMQLVVDGTKSPGQRADALWAVKELLPSIWQIMVANTQQTGQVLKACFDTPSEAVRANAGELLCTLIDNLERKEDRAPFLLLTEDLCKTVKVLAESADSSLLNKLLQALQGTGPLADFFKDSFGSHLLPVLTTIAKSHKEEDVQRMALEAMVSLAESKAKAFAKIPGFVQAVLEVCVAFLTALDDDVDSWGKEDDETADDEENFKVGTEVVDRLCKFTKSADKFPAVLELIKPAIASLFQAGGWKETVAGLAIISQLLEYIDDEEMLVQLFGAVKAQLQASSPRVRHAAWSALAQFSEDHSEFVTSEQVAAEILPEFVKGLNEPCSRTKERCMEAFQFYGSEVERDILEPYVQGMMVTLGQLLQQPSLPIQRKTITFIAVLAGQMEDGFATYYATLMPILKQIVQSLLHNTEERSLLGKTFECISMLGAAVGAEGFKPDAEVIMQAMIQATQVPNLPANDPVREYMLQASQRICTFIKGDFVKFLPLILESILQKFSLKPKEYNKELASTLGDDDEVNLSLTQGEDGKVKVMIMSTSDAEEVSEAVSCVHTFVQELGKLYAPFMSHTAQALLLVFDFPMDEEVRNLAFDTWGNLCQCARENNQMDVVSNLVMEFLNRMLPKLEHVVSASTAAQAQAVDLECLKTTADGVTACLRKAGPGVLTAQQIGHICKVALSCWSHTLNKRDADEAERRKTPGDEEDNDQEDDQDGVNFCIACSELIGSLAKHHPDIFMEQCVGQCMPLVTRFLQPNVRWDDRRLAIFVVVDMVEFLRERFVPFWPQCMPQLVEDILHQSPALRQPACFAMSLAAREAAFAEFAPVAATALSRLVTETRGRKKKDKVAQACADNAVSAVAEIVTTHRQAVASQEGQLWGVWLGGLPCQQDEEEGVKNHKRLLELVRAEAPQVLGEGGANLAKVLSILVEVYRSDMADEETSKGIGQLVVKLGPQMLEQLAGQLSEKQRKKLLRIHKEAQ